MQKDPFSTHAASDLLIPLPYAMVGHVVVSSPGKNRRVARLEAGHKTLSKDRESLERT